ncbi:lipoprotein signal peptidase [Neisseria sp. Dent CA1/247]|uniref:lipoprotein signal peptidase n=1 Tax=Neisseria sp. Dent CA1/247 TaxID=2912675 RepID=UPI001FCFC500|nr:lipoprotein signal peptidase [Neisseria sp. Dent CA1/247]UOO78242.1 lipoprotein signal peptidase [Neisseria sp. Dent CA1/247]
MRRISALCAARSFSLVYDMSAPAALLSLKLHPHLRVLQGLGFFRRPESLLLI